MDSDATNDGDFWSEEELMALLPNSLSRAEAEEIFQMVEPGSLKPNVAAKILKAVKPNSFSAENILQALESEPVNPDDVAKILQAVEPESLNSAVENISKMTGISIEQLSENIPHLSEKTKNEKEEI